MSSLRITYKKSTIGYSIDQKATVRSLGLRKLNQVVVRPDSPTLRGMLFKVRHLVTFEEVDEAAPPSTRRSLVAQSLASEADDITQIEGIGPKIAELLRANDISTFAQLAAASVEQLRGILQQQPRLRLADPTTWPEQARLAAAGQWDEFKQLTDQLRSGRQV
jgi:large subunit ribosomal protein L30